MSWRASAERKCGKSTPGSLCSPSGLATPDSTSSLKTVVRLLSRLVGGWKGVGALGAAFGLTASSSA